ncbi:hypothetical protein, partial [Serratia rubidaea]|uniref:hypothetical protein n=1 Tax=Serratia rubidaea TaxID=61652 RepID=UPI001F3A793A
HALPNNRLYQQSERNQGCAFFYLSVRYFNIFTVNPRAVAARLNLIIRYYRDNQAVFITSRAGRHQHVAIY